MANPRPIIFDIEGLNALAARFRDHAEDIADTIDFEPVVRDIRLAATVCSNFATLRFRLAEIAEIALVHASTYVENVAGQVRPFVRERLPAHGFHRREPT